MSSLAKTLAAPFLIVRAILAHVRRRRASVQLSRPQPEHRLVARSTR